MPSSFVQGSLSLGSEWSSASKEFEHLKLMYDDAMVGLQTQLQILENEEGEMANDRSPGELAQNMQVGSILTDEGNT